MVGQPASKVDFGLASIAGAAVGASAEETAAAGPARAAAAARVRTARLSTPQKTQRINKRKIMRLSDLFVAKSAARWRGGGSKWRHLETVSRLLRVEQVKPLIGESLGPARSLEQTESGLTFNLILNAKTNL